MEESWKIFLYRTAKEDSPVKEFIDSLEIKSQSKVRNTIQLLRNFGTRLGPPHTKKLTGTELWELRILGADNIRVLYVAIMDKTFLLLHGFKKKKDKTPQKDIKMAVSRLAEHNSRS